MRIAGLALIFFLTVLHSGAKPARTTISLISIKLARYIISADHLILQKNEIIFAGDVIREGTRSSLDGWFVKLSAQGTVLTKKYYSSVFYNYIRFNKAIPADADNYFLIGNIGNVDTTKVPPAPYTQYGFLVKVDKHGNILWSQMFGKTFVTNLSTDINNIISTGTGDYILSLDYNSSNSSSIIVRIDKDGNIKWTTTLYSASHQVSYGQMVIKQMRNGDLVLAHRIIMYDRTSWANTKYGYYLASLDSAAGLRNWERTFFYADTLSTRKSVEDVVNISELPNGNISFISSYADTASIYFRRSSRVINFITDNIGRPKKVISYRTRGATLYASSANEVNQGERVVLMDNADASFLMKIDSSGAVKWEKGYAKTGRSQETSSILCTTEGSYFFSFTHDGGSTDITLVKTDTEGNADCVQSPLNLIVEDVSNAFREYKINLDVDQAPGKWYSVIAMGAGEYKMSETVSCKKTCCTELIDTAVDIDICNASTYTLPDGYVASASGAYQITYKTRIGCDSIVYYRIRFTSAPQVNLGRDVCLDGKDSVVLRD